MRQSALNEQQAQFLRNEKEALASEIRSAYERGQAHALVVV